MARCCHAHILIDPMLRGEGEVRGKEHNKGVNIWTQKTTRMKCDRKSDRLSAYFKILLK